MSSKVSRYKRKKEKKAFKIYFNIEKFLFFLILIGLLAYAVFAYVGFKNIKSEDILAKGNSDFYLLSKQRDQLDKTLIVFEQEYNGKDKISMAYLYSENKEKEVSVLTYIPGWVEYTEVKEDFGSSIPISSFRFAGDFLQEGRGFEYAIWQFEQLLGGNIDDYIWISSDAFAVFSDRLGEASGDTVFAQYYVNGFDVNQEAFLLNSFVSKMGWLNLAISSSKFRDAQAVIYSSMSTLGNTVGKLKQIHSSILSTRPYLIDLSSSSFLSQQESSSGVGITSYINTAEYDEIWREFADSMIDRQLEKERVRVEVYNGSGMSGYAGQYARRIRNSGCEVVRFDNAPEEYEKTKFYIPKPDDFKYSLKVIRELFPGTYEIIEGRPSFMTTGDIVIILGKDIPTVYSF